MLLALFLFLWTGIAFAAQDTWSGVERVIALGDVHGDYQQFVTLLRAAGVIDQQKTRGPAAKPISCRLAMSWIAVPNRAAPWTC